MKKIAIIICYFGRLPDYYYLWEKSALYNSSIDFLFFTDIEEIKNHSNIYVYNFTLETLKNLIEEQLGQNIKLKNPYKLCDYRLMYGDVFRDYLEEYDFWGYCDLDLIFGDIRNFLNEKILIKNDKILENGHLTLYRNKVEICNLYKNDGGFPECNYREVINTDLACYFDEFTGGIPKSLRCIEKIYRNKNIFVDISYLYYNFRDFNGKKFDKFVWDNGKLYAYPKKEKYKEILYVHMQKRKFKYICHDSEYRFAIYPEGMYGGMYLNKVDLWANIKFILKKKIEAICKHFSKSVKDVLDVEVPGYGIRRIAWRDYIEKLESLRKINKN